MRYTDDFWGMRETYSPKAQEIMNKFGGTYTQAIIIGLIREPYSENSSYKFVSTEYGRKYLKRKDKKLPWGEIKMTKYKVYDLYVFGGSIGEISHHVGGTKHFPGVGTGRFYGRYDTRKQAQDAGKSYVRSFSGGYRNYYRPRYRIVEEIETDYDPQGSGLGRYPNY